MRRAAALRGAAAAVLVVIAVAAIVIVRPAGRDAEPSAAAPRASTPTLYCEFYNLMHNATVVSFLFAVEAPASAAPRFNEISTIQPDGTQTSFDSNQRPQWSYAVVDGTGEIASPDGDTRIMLYGLEPGLGGVVWTEAGIRSDIYKNLGGKCRQAYFGRT